MSALINWFVSWYNDLQAWWNQRPWAVTHLEYSPSLDISGFLGLLAFSVAVFTLTSPKFQIRQSTAVIPFRPLFFWVLICSGLVTFGLQVAVLLDLSFPFWLNPNIVNLVVAAVLAILIVYWMKICFIRPPRFGKLTARHYFDVTFSYVANGSREEVLALAREIMHELPRIIKNCPKRDRFPYRVPPTEKLSETEKCAHNLLLMLSDSRFCDAVASELPSFPAYLVEQMIALKRPDVPAHLMVRRLTISLLALPRSALFVENEWLEQGYMGEVKPITNAIFFNWHKVERYESGVESPLDLDYPYAQSWDTETWRVYFGIARIYLQGLADANLGSSTGRGVYHIFETTKRAYEQLGKLENYDGLSNPRNPYWHASEANRFINDIIKIFEQAEDYVYFDRKSQYDYGDDLASKIARLTSEAIYFASEVNTLEFRMWDIQHNLVWRMLEQYSVKDSAIQKMARRKLRRLIWDEIKRMDEFPNYKGARYIRFCLNVLGFYDERIHRKDVLERDSWPLTRCVSRWLARNYCGLAETHPPIAEFMLPASISYDKKNCRLVRKKFDEMTGKETLKYFALREMTTAVGNK